MLKFIELNNRTGIPTLINIAEILVAKDYGDDEISLWLKSEPQNSLVYVISYKEFVAALEKVSTIAKRISV